MGKRKTATTKGGRYMNPADQVRKAARKRELKKNKKTRLLVRQAVLKSKEPEQIMEELERIDKMEYTVDEEHAVNPRVLQEKRKKLCETYRRVMIMYLKDKPEYGRELRTQFDAYENHRKAMEEHVAAVRFSRDVNPADIPLPEMAPPPQHFMSLGNMTIPVQPPSIPLPPDHPLHSILKRKDQQAAAGASTSATSNQSTSTRGRKEPPGPPPGIPAELSDSDDDDVDKGITDSSKSKVRFDVEDSGEKDSRTKYKELAKQIAVGQRAPGDPMHAETPNFPPLQPPIHSAMNPLGAVPPPPSLGMPSGHLMGGRLPMPMPGFPLPPPGSHHPPRMPRHLHVPPPPPLANAPPGAVLSAPPSIHARTVRIDQALASTSDPSAADTGGGPIIEAKPQLRNMTAEVTKLVPTSVKIHRNPTAASVSQTKKLPTARTPATFAKPAPVSMQPAKLQQTKDDAYDQFMREMDGLL